MSAAENSIGGGEGATWWRHVAGVTRRGVEKQIRGKPVAGGKEENQRLIINSYAKLHHRREGYASASKSHHILEEFHKRTLSEPIVRNRHRISDAYCAREQVPALWRSERPVSWFRITLTCHLFLLAS